MIYQPIPDKKIEVATTSSNGLMSATDKTLVNKIGSGTLNTTSQTLVGAVNELNSGASGGSIKTEYFTLCPAGTYPVSQTGDPYTKIIFNMDNNYYLHSDNNLFYINKFDFTKDWYEGMITSTFDLPHSVPPLWWKSGENMGYVSQCLQLKSVNNFSFNILDVSLEISAIDINNINLIIDDSISGESYIDSEQKHINYNNNLNSLKDNSEFSIVLCTGYLDNNYSLRITNYHFLNSTDSHILSFGKPVYEEDVRPYVYYINPSYDNSYFTLLGNNSFNSIKDSSGTIVYSPLFTSDVVSSYYPITELLRSNDYFTNEDPMFFLKIISDTEDQISYTLKKPIRIKVTYI